MVVLLSVGLFRQTGHVNLVSNGARRCVLTGNCFEVFLNDFDHYFV